jgi:phosphate-selective porin OprO and OprP
MRTMKFALMAGVAIATVMVATPAFAQSDDAEIEQLRSEVADLKAQLAAISAKLDAVVAAPAPAAATPVAAKPADAAKKAPEITFKGAPEIKGEGGWSFKPRGRIHYDTGFVSTPGALNTTRNLGFNSRVRRVRLGAEGTMPGGFGYKVETDFAGGGVSFGEVFLSYTDGGLGVRMGNFDTMNGMEQITSSNNITFLERASFNDAFLNSRRLGAAVAWNSANKDIRVEGGLFTAHSIDSSFDNDGWIGAARLVYAPKALGGQLHFGLGYQHRDFASNFNGATASGVNMPSTNQLARYRARPNSQLTDVRFVDTGSFAAKRDRILGVEVAGIFDSLYFGAEAQWLKASGYDAGDLASGLDAFSGGNIAVTAAGNPGFFGAYGEVGFFLTGETRGYKHGEGVWNRTKVKNPLGSGGSGAFQIAGRFEHLDLDDAALKNGLTNNFTNGTTSLAALNSRLGRGGTQDSYMLALNWYPIDYIRFMLNYARVNVEGGPIAISAKPLSTSPVDERSYGVDVFAARMQVEF